jgi:mRNA interferase HigB
MRVISKARLKKFWESRDSEDSEQPLRAWYTLVSNREVAWQNWGDVRAMYGSAGLVGNCVVFNVAGNKYRLITRILYPSQKVFVLKVMTHKEYDKDLWKEECGCFSPPPKKKKSAARPPKRKRRGR